MRVALVSPYDLDAHGGVQAHVLELAAALRAAGDDVVVIGPGGGSVDGVRCVGGSVRVPFNESVAPIALSPLAARRTTDVVREVRPDVIHVHEPAVPVVSLSALLASEVPTAGTFHAWSERGRAYRLARPLLRPAMSRLAARLAVSPAARDYHARCLGMPAGSFQVIPNGLDVASFAAAEPYEKLRQGEETLLFLGRLEPRKGPEQLLRAYLRLKVHRPGLRLIVAGEGPERERCQDMVPVRLRSDVLFLGRVSDTGKRRLLRSCDVFVAPATGGESFGIVLVEAMAAGTAVVASDIPGFRSVVTDGRDGRLVAPGQPDAIAEAVADLLDNAALRDALAAAARETVANYDWSRVAARVRGVYARIA